MAATQRWGGVEEKPMMTHSGQLRAVHLPLSSTGACTYVVHFRDGDAQTLFICIIFLTITTLEKETSTFSIDSPLSPSFLCYRI